MLSTTKNITIPATYQCFIKASAGAQKPAAGLPRNRLLLFLNRNILITPFACHSFSKSGSYPFAIIIFLLFIFPTRTYIPPCAAHQAINLRRWVIMQPLLKLRPKFAWASESWPCRERRRKAAVSEARTTNPRICLGLRFSVSSIIISNPAHGMYREGTAYGVCQEAALVSYSCLAGTGRKKSDLLWPTHHAVFKMELAVGNHPQSRQSMLASTFVQGEGLDATKAYNRLSQPLGITSCGLQNCLHCHIRFSLSVKELPVVLPSTVRSTGITLESAAFKNMQQSSGDEARYNPLKFNLWQGSGRQQ